MKRIYCLLFAVLFFISCEKNGFVYAYSAESWCVMDALTGDVISSGGADTKKGMASTTKIMTAIVALESASGDDIATVSYNASRTEGSSLYLKPDEKMSVSDLIYGLMLNSGNDAAVVLAEHIGGSVENFAAMMNATAQKIGAVNTNFTNPNGLHDGNHYTTAYDLALITRYGMENDIFKKIVATKRYTAKTIATDKHESRNIYLLNHNKLLDMMEGCGGVKTGFTKKTGRCLVSYAENNGVELICVTLNAPDDWNDHISMYKTNFPKYSNRKIISKGDFIKTVIVERGQAECIGLVASEDVFIAERNGNKTGFELVCNVEENISAPIHHGEVYGSADVIVCTRKIATISLVADRSVEIEREPTFYDWLKTLIKAAVLVF